MHLQLNLSNQLAKQWKTPVCDILPETHPLLRWRIDKMKLGRTTANYVCVNEASLFSFVLANAAGIKAAKLQQMFLTRLRYILKYHNFSKEAQESLNQPTVLFGKTRSPKVIGAVTGIRHMYNDMYEYSQVPQVVTEQRANATPMCGPNYIFPIEEFLRLRNLFEDRNKRRVTFTLPKELRWFTLRALRDCFTFPLNCFSNKIETAVLPVDDLMILHEGILETLVLNQIKAEDIKRLKDLDAQLLDAIKSFLAGEDQT